MQSYEKYNKNSFGVDLPEIYNKYKNANGTLVFNEGTDNEVLFVPIEATGEFPMLSISRDDLEAVGFDGSQVDDEKMKYISSKMADVLVENYYWESLKYFCEHHDIPCLTK